MTSLTGDDIEIRFQRRSTHRSTEILRLNGPSSASRVVP